MSVIANDEPAFAVVKGETQPQCHLGNKLVRRWNLLHARSAVMAAETAALEVELALQEMGRRP